MTTTLAAPVPPGPDDWALDDPELDQTHREFVDALAVLQGAAAAADSAAAAAALAQLVTHTEAHFAQEAAWMDALGFDAEHCHRGQHAQVLELLHAVQQREREQGPQALLALAAQLPAALMEWFVPHAQNLDAGLLQLLRLKQPLRLAPAAH